MHNSEATEAFEVARAGYESARAAFFDPANANDESCTRRLGTAERIYRVKFDALIAALPHADAVGWYHTVLVELGRHLLGCARENIHPFSAAATTETWRLMRSWRRMEEEVSELGDRTIVLEDMLKAACNSLSPEHVPLYHLLAVPRAKGERVEHHSFTWIPGERAAATRTDELIEITKRIAEAGSRW